MTTPNVFRFVSSTGFVGIGTNNPVALLDVSAGAVAGSNFTGLGAGLTGLNATGITTGTLAAARLPTSGVTSATYGSASAIPVVSVDATGRVTNVSSSAIAASQWTTSGSNIYYTTGNVGIGTLTPQTTFHVHGNVTLSKTELTGGALTVTTLMSGISSRTITINSVNYTLRSGSSSIATHTMVIDNNSNIWGCGYNISGQLGNNASINNFYIPIAVNTASGTSSLFGRTVVALAVGNAHTVALDSTGAVHAWGGNVNGQLGDNSTTQRNAPVLVNTTSGTSSLFGRTVVAMSAGGSHTVALDSTGAVHAWGINSSGQLGNNTTTQSNVPVRVNTASGTSSLFGRTVVALAAGNSHTVALDSTGAVHAWGANVNGQLGDNSTTQRNAPVLVNTTSGTSSLFGRTVVAMSAVGSHTLALDSTGAVHAWGQNGNGQLGDNTTTQRNAPVLSMQTTYLNQPYLLELSSDYATKPATSTWIVVSDERLKTDIAVANYDRCYEILKGLDLKHYRYNSNIAGLGPRNIPDQGRLGWIAQDVQPIFPKAIHQVPEQYGLTQVLNVNFDQIYAVMYGAMKKMQGTLEQLDGEVQDLKGRLATSNLAPV